MGLGRFFWCAATECYCKMVTGGEAELEFGDLRSHAECLRTLKLSLMHLSILLRIEGAKFQCSELATGTLESYHK